MAKRSMAPAGAFAAAAALQRSRRAGEEMGPQHLAPGTAGLQVKGVDDGQSKAAGRHGVALGFLVLMKRDLHARDTGQAPHLRHERGRRMAIARTVRPEQHDAVSVAPVLIGEVPAPLLVEAHERIDPAGPIEVRPLIAHAQMHLDHATADGLGVEDAGVALEMPADPRAAIRLDAGIEAYCGADRKSTRLNSSHTVISYAVFCLKKKKA